MLFYLPKNKQKVSEKIVTGTVKWFSPVKGYGFIAGDNGMDAFVHHTAIMMNGL